MSFYSLLVSVGSFWSRLSFGVSAGVFLITQTQKAHLGKAGEGGERHGQCVSSRELPAGQGKLLGRCSGEKDAHLEKVPIQPQNCLVPGSIAAEHALYNTWGAK